MSGGSLTRGPATRALRVLHFLALVRKVVVPGPGRKHRGGRISPHARPHHTAHTAAARTHAHAHTSLRIGYAALLHNWPHQVYSCGPSFSFIETCTWKRLGIAGGDADLAAAAATEASWSSSTMAKQS